MPEVVMFLAGAVAGILLTAYLHESPTPWAERIGHTRWRYANLPLGGFVALVVAGITWSSLIAALGVGMMLAAVGWRFVDPLPPAEKDPLTSRTQA